MDFLGWTESWRVEEGEEAWVRSAGTVGRTGQAGQDRFSLAPFFFFPFPFLPNAHHHFLFFPTRRFTPRLAGFAFPPLARDHNHEHQYRHLHPHQPSPTRLLRAAPRPRVSRVSAPSSRPPLPDTTTATPPSPAATTTTPQERHNALVSTGQ
ncbi:hypothetical protein LZ30DRAFT_415482 [Colletotrichum cereale]|nr:hypothetical protein LZ30DRAFT_415482 [Colletotrichum cereale]